MRLVYVAVFLAACQTSSDESAKPAKPTPPTTPQIAPADAAAPATPAKPIAFGDCSDATTAFVVGPRPQPIPTQTAGAGGVGEPTGLMGHFGPGAQAFRPSVPKYSYDFSLSDGIGVAGLGPTRVTKSSTGSSAGVNGLDNQGVLGTLRGAEGAPDGDVGIGYGQGYPGRGFPGRRMPAPALTFGPPNKIQGVLVDEAKDKDIIRRYMKRNQSRLQYCYEKQLLVKSDLAGSVTVIFGISPNGSVAMASANGMDTDVASCVAQAVKTIEFPKPKSESVVMVSYVLKFQNTGDEAAFRPRVPTLPPTTKPVPKLPPPRPADGRLLFKPRTEGDVDLTGYVTGSTNPLKAHEMHLAPCFAKVDRAALVVELPSGNVLGTDDTTLKSCVGDMAKMIKADKPMRCPLAVGAPADAAFTTIAITNDNIELAGKPIAKVSELLADSVPLISVPLRDALVEPRKPIVAADGAPLVEHLPVLVKPADATPMKVVTIVASSVFAAGSDLVFSYQQRPATFVPVAFGTGAMWHPVRMPGAREAEKAVLSVLVRKADVWMVVTGQPPKTIQLRDLESTLGTMTKMTLELAGANDAIYGDFVKAIEAATKAGFTWKVVSPVDLGTVPPP